MEVPTFADDTGVRPTRVGALPPQCAAACMTNVNVQQLTADAALSGDPEHIVHALALDPLTAPSARSRRSATWPPRCSRRSARGCPSSRGARYAQLRRSAFRRMCVPVEVPLDPALAIHQRFGKLVSQKTG